MIYDTLCAVTCDYNNYIARAEAYDATRETCAQCGTSLDEYVAYLDGCCHECARPCSVAGCPNAAASESEDGQCAACELDGARWELAHGDTDENHAAVKHWEVVA